MQEDLQSAEARNQFLEAVKAVSIEARFALICCFLAEYCHRKRVTSQLLDDMLNWLWEFHTGCGEFHVWYDRMPALARSCLAGEVSETLNGNVHVADGELARLASLTEVLFWSVHVSFWGAPELKATFEHVEIALKAARPEQLPALTVFKCARASDYDMRLQLVTGEDYNFWRHYSETWMHWQIECS